MAQGFGPPGLSPLTQLDFAVPTAQTGAANIALGAPVGISPSSTTLVITTLVLALTAQNLLPLNTPVVPAPFVQPTSQLAAIIQPLQSTSVKSLALTGAPPAPMPFTGIPTRLAYATPALWQQQSIFQLLDIRPFSNKAIQPTVISPVLTQFTQTNFGLLGPPPVPFKPVQITLAPATLAPALTQYTSSAFALTNAPTLPPKSGAAAQLQFFGSQLRQDAQTNFTLLNIQPFTNNGVQPSFQQPQFAALSGNTFALQNASLPFSSVSTQLAYTVQSPSVISPALSLNTTLSVIPFTNLTAQLANIILPIASTQTFPFQIASYPPYELPINDTHDGYKRPTDEIAAEKYRREKAELSEIIARRMRGEAPLDKNAVPFEAAPEIKALESSVDPLANLLDVVLSYHTAQQRAADDDIAFVLAMLD